MTIDKSLKVRAGLVRARSVLTRAERIAKLQQADRWLEGSSPMGLPKVRVIKLVLKKKKKAKAKKGKTGELIISKSRTKRAVKKCNVGAEFYPALDAVVRDLIKGAEARATGNKRKTLKAVDL